MKYKVGDRVKVKSFDWYNQNKDKSGSFLVKDTIAFTRGMADYCGQVMTIERVDCRDNSYFMNEFWWTDDMIDGLAEKDTEGAMKEIAFTHHIGLDSEEIHVADGFEFQDENGNVINVSKVKIVKKKPKYPTTYEECCKVLGCKRIVGFVGLDDEEKNLYGKFIVLKRCQDAYWKIADWKPDFEDANLNGYVIFTNSNGCIIKECYAICSNKILVFPTSEMRDTFYENFNDLIESCKELL